MEDVNVILEVDGEDVLLNDFVRKIIAGMISGSVGTLRDVRDDWKTISISLKRN